MLNKILEEAQLLIIHLNHEIADEVKKVDHDVITTKHHHLRQARDKAIAMLVSLEAIK
jgi:hypothetical protein